MPRLEEIHANLVDRLAEAKKQGWLGEVAAIGTTMAAAAQKLEAMRAARNATQRYRFLRLVHNALRIHTNGPDEHTVGAHFHSLTNALDNYIRQLTTTIDNGAESCRIHRFSAL